MNWLKQGDLDAERRDDGLTTSERQNSRDYDTKMSGLSLLPSYSAGSSVGFGAPKRGLRASGV